MTEEIVEEEGAMTREEVLAYIQKEFGTRLKHAKVEVEDTPRSFAFVVNDALQGHNARTIKTRANYYTLLRLRDALAHQTMDAPKGLADEIDAAHTKVVAAYPKGA